MKLSMPKLQRGTCLGQLTAHSIDVALPDGPIQSLPCQNDSLLPSCKQLGRQIWFSEDNAHFTWEMTDTSYGGFILVNEQRVKDLLFTDIAMEMDDYKQTEENPYPLDVIFINQKGQKRYVGVEMVLLGDEVHRGFFPHQRDPILCDKLIELIRKCYQGEEAYLYLLITNSYINHLYLAAQIDPQTASLLEDAIDAGVDIRVRKIQLQDNELFLNKDIPFIVY